jgi:peptide/nickel transport system permease protein
MGMLRRLWRMPSARVSLLLLVLVLVLAVAGGALAPHDPLAQDPGVRLQGPSGQHLLGTDYLGRDVLSRIMEGARLSVAGAVEAVAAAMAVGVPAGLASVWFGRGFEWFSLRVSDTLMVLPFTVFAIAVVGTLGNGLHQSMLALGILLAPLYFRVSRAVTLGLRQSQYVEAAELMGASQWWILRTHIWSKVMPTIAVTTAQAIGTALLVVASLTFLGLGVAPPAPTWGGMLASDLGYLSQQPWAPFYPGIVIMVTVGSLNLLADAIRDAGPDDVRLGRRRASTVDATPGLVGSVTPTRDPSPRLPFPDGTTEEGTDDRVTAA